MIGQGGLEEVRVGLTCIRIRQRCEGSLRPTAAVAQGASHFPLQDVCVFLLTDKIQLYVCGCAWAAHQRGGFSCRAAVNICVKVKLF